MLYWSAMWLGDSVMLIMTALPSSAVLWLLSRTFFQVDDLAAVLALHVCFAVSCPGFAYVMATLLPAGSKPTKTLFLIVPALFLYSSVILDFYLGSESAASLDASYVFCIHPAYALARGVSLIVQHSYEEHMGSSSTSAFEVRCSGCIPCTEAKSIVFVCVNRGLRILHSLPRDRFACGCG